MHNLTLVGRYFGVCVWWRGGRCSRLMINALDSQSNGPGSSWPKSLCYVLGQDTLLS